jgi:ribosome-associated protein
LATKKREETRGKATPKQAKSDEGGARRPVRRAAAGAKPAAARPRLRTHATTPEGAAAPRRRKEVAGASIAAAVKAGRGAGPELRKAPLAAPKRTTKRSVPPGAGPESAGAGRPEPSSAARELALALASAGLEMKAIGIEILDVTGKVDYADFLVVMTGRSDRHVYAIAMGLEEGVRKFKIAPLSVEGLTASTWVLIDFGDVVVHVFQEEARSLYDIEGLWISAGRVPVPADEGAPGGKLNAGSSDLG